MNIILLSGGSGRRLWPLSNDVRSKQFIKIFRTEDGYESMLQRVYRQLKEVDETAGITIATSKTQVSAIRNQLGEQVDICVEPQRRDTFPAIVLAASYLKDIKGISESETMVVCPVDSYVEKDFFEAVKNLSQLVDMDSADEAGLEMTKAAIGSVKEDGVGNTKRAAMAGNAVNNADANPKARVALLGVEPTYASEKYGYILPESAAQVSTIKEYHEKPGHEDAEKYLKQGALWNAGVFAFQIGHILKLAHEMIEFSDYDDLYNKYDDLKKTSFDYAVAEKEQGMKVLRFAGAWKDMGTWNTLTDAMEDPVIGKAIISDTCKNVHVLNDLDVPVLCMGLSDVVITTSPEGILVSDKEQSSRIKPYVEQVKQQIMFAEKSWGEFRVLDVEEESMTVKVTLNPGHSMNYHSHLHRDEVWTVISGTGHTIVDGMEQPVSAGDVITMQAGCRHTVVAETELKLIEVQLGKDISVSDKKKYRLEE